MIFVPLNGAHTTPVIVIIVLLVFYVRETFKLKTRGLNCVNRKATKKKKNTSQYALPLYKYKNRLNSTMLTVHDNK